METTAPPRTQDLSTREALKLWVVLSRAYAEVARVSRRDIARHGLTPGEFGVLEALYHKGPLLLGELRRKVLVSSGGTTYLVDRLVARGFVERRECPDDARARYAALTETGKRLIARVFPAHAERMAEAVSGLDAADRRLATDLLKRLGRAAERKGGTKER